MKRWVVGLVVVLAAGCSSPADVASPPPSETPTPSVSSTPTPTPKPKPTPTPVAPSTPEFVPLPLEGRNLKSCRDGHCRVNVRTGDRIAVPAGAGGSPIRIKAISRAEITIEMGPTTTFTFFAPGPTGLGEDKLLVAFSDLRPGHAIMQIDL